MICFESSSFIIVIEESYEDDIYDNNDIIFWVNCW